MPRLEQDRRVGRGEAERHVDRRVSGRLVFLADRQRGGEIPQERILGDGGRRFLDLGARGLEIVLGFGGAGAVEQGLAALLGLEPRSGKGPVSFFRISRSLLTCSATLPSKNSLTTSLCWFSDLANCCLCT